MEPDFLVELFDENLGQVGPECAISGPSSGGFCDSFPSVKGKYRLLKKLTKPLETNEEHTKLDLIVYKNEYMFSC